MGTGIDASKRGQETYYYHQDEQLSTVFITDEIGGIRNSYQYDAFGNELDSVEQLSNYIRYTRQQYDELTGQYYLRARYYNPVLGIFMQEDEYQGDGLNLYDYCSNNPVMYYDPSGYAKKKNNDCPPQGIFADDGSLEVNKSGKTSNPTFKVSRKQYPNHVKMLENAQQEGHSLKNLTRGSGTRAAKKNRYEAQKAIRKQRGGPPKDYDYDEFPYASTKQGGAGAHVEPVLSVENRAVGRDLGQFYKKYNIREDDLFDIEIID